jgi:hypothetical protein
VSWPMCAGKQTQSLELNYTRANSTSTFFRAACRFRCAVTCLPALKKVAMNYVDGCASAAPLQRKEDETVVVFCPKLEYDRQTVVPASLA